MPAHTKYDAVQKKKLNMTGLPGTGSAGRSFALILNAVWREAGLSAQPLSCCESCSLKNMFEIKIRIIKHFKYD